MDITTLKGNTLTNSNLPSLNGGNVNSIGNIVGKNGIGGMIKNWIGAGLIKERNKE